MNPSRSTKHPLIQRLIIQTVFFHRDFEEDGENPDWVSELQKQVGWQDVYDGKLLGERA